MFFKVLKEDIIEGVNKASGILPIKSGAAYLRAIWLKVEADTLSIMATDTALEFTGKYLATVVEPGLVGVQGRNFSDLVRKLPPGEISFRLDEKKQNLVIEQGRKRYKLPVYDDSWFQDVVAFPETQSVLWSGDFFKELIDKVSFCIADEEAMQGMYCMKLAAGRDDEVEVCGLNGHQLALVSFVNPEIKNLLGEEGILIAKKYLSEIRKYLSAAEIEFSIVDRRLFLRTGQKKEMLSLPLKNYTFPDYRNFIQQYTNKFTSNMKVSKMDLAESLDRINIFNTDTSKSTFFEFQGLELTLSAQGLEVGEGSELLNVEFTGNLEKIALSTKLLIDILSHFVSPAVLFEFAGVTEPCKITGSEDGNYLVITMPVEIATNDTYSVEGEEGLKAGEING